MGASSGTSAGQRGLHRFLHLDGGEQATESGGTSGGYTPGAFAVSRPRMRRPSKGVGAATAGLLQEFRQPATILDAVVHYSGANASDAMDTLGEAFPALQSLIAGDILVPAASPLASAVSATFTAGMRCGEFQIARLVHSLDDTELYEAVSAIGVRVALKLLRQNSSAETRKMIDKVVREPLGGAHRDPHAMAVRLKAVLLNQLDALERSDSAGLVEQRYKRLRRYGAFKAA